MKEQPLYSRQMNMPLIIPKPLRFGSRIAILSPAGIASKNNVEAAMAILERQGWQPILMPHALNIHGSYSAPLADRLSDIRNALLDPKIDAIICSRGGYGTVQLLEYLNQLDIRANAKWMVGFSDISALHALFSAHAVASIHGPMAKHISANGGDNTNFKALCRILSGENPACTLPGHPLNRNGHVHAPLTGGNMAVLGGLFGTPFNAIRPGSILFIEDIAEPIYKIERQLYQLRLNGVLSRLAGLLVGRFTDYSPDRNHSSMEEMISDMVDGYDYPVAFGIPAGHGGEAMPMVLGAEMDLSVLPGRTVLSSTVY